MCFLAEQCEAFISSVEAFDVRGMVNTAEDRDDDHDEHYHHQTHHNDAEAAHVVL